VIVPITVVAVAVWLLLVFGAWKILKRRKRKAWEEKNPQEQFEKPEVPPKAAKKKPLRFELPGERIFSIFFCTRKFRKLRNAPELDIWLPIS